MMLIKLIIALLTLIIGIYITRKELSALLMIFTEEEYITLEELKLMGNGQSSCRV